MGNPLQHLKFFRFHFHLEAVVLLHCNWQGSWLRCSRSLQKSTPYAFTEQGIAMLSSILRSKRAIPVNIEIMRAFVRWRKMLASQVKLARKLDSLENMIRHSKEYVLLWRPAFPYWEEFSLL
jgi:hypothetical protein